MDTYIYTLEYVSLYICIYTDRCAHIRMFRSKLFRISTKTPGLGQADQSLGPMPQDPNQTITPGDFQIQ